MMNNIFMKHNLSICVFIASIVTILIIEAIIFIPSLYNFRTAYLKNLTEKADLLLQADIIATNTMGINFDKVISLNIMNKLNAIYMERENDMETFKAASPLFTRHYQSLTKKPAINIDEESWLDAIFKDIIYIFFNDSKVKYIESTSNVDPESTIRVLFINTEYKTEIINFGYRILLLSLLISTVTGLALFILLHKTVTNPIKNIAQNCQNFAKNPDNKSNILYESKRYDEIGMIHNSISNMQKDIVEAFDQQKRLVLVGSAILKIQHDLRGILSSAALVIDTLQNSQDEKVKIIAPIITDSIDSAISLCSSTLDYIDGTNHKRINTKIDLQDIIKKMILAHAQQVTIHHNIDEPLFIVANDNMMIRVFNNLIRNAINACADIITIHLKKHARYITLAITDNGRGINKDIHDNIFDPFVKTGRGAGLGLCIVEELLDIHHGHIKLSKTDNTGTEFKISLPK